MIISVHVPKTGGTTFLEFLFNNYSENIVSEYHNLRSLKDNKLVTIIPPKTEILHIHYRADKYDKLYPKAKLLIWLRNPIDRYLSLYYDFLRRPDFNNNQCKLLYKNDCDLEYFVKNIKVDSITDFMGSKNLSDFSFIGITETYNKSIDMFCKMFNIKIPRNLELLNKNPKKIIGDKYKVNPKIKNHLEKVLKEDISLYREARNIFSKRLNNKLNI
jgi:hypothetical protein